MEYKKMNQTDEKRANDVVHKVNNNSLASLAIVLSTATLILSAVIIPCITVLYRDYFKLKTEIMAQKELLSSCTNGRNDLSLMDTYSETDVLSRERRSDGSNRRNNNNNRRNNNNNRRHNNKKNEGISQSGTEVVHLEIDLRHETLLHLSEEEVRTPTRGQTIPYWKFSDNDFNTYQTFANLNTPEGSVTIKKPGMYFIYSQMTYYDRSGRWSHRMDIDNTPFIKCLASEWGIETDPDTGLHYNTIHQCYTAAVTYINRHQKITMKGMYPNRTIHTDKDMSFFGIIKLT